MSTNLHEIIDARPASLSQDIEQVTPSPTCRVKVRVRAIDSNRYFLKHERNAPVSIQYLVRPYLGISLCAFQTQSNSIVGFASAVSLCFCSGLAGVFFELMLKVRREHSSSDMIYFRSAPLSVSDCYVTATASGHAHCPNSRRWRTQVDGF